MGSNPAAPTKKNQYTFVYWFFFVSARDLNRAAVRSTANKAIVWLCLARGFHRLGMSNKVHAANTFVYWFFFVSARDLQQRRPLPAAETGRSCWGRVLIFQSPAKGLQKNQQTQPVRPCTAGQAISPAGCCLVRGSQRVGMSNNRLRFTVRREDSNKAAARSVASKATARLCLACGCQPVGMSNKRTTVHPGENRTVLKPVKHICVLVFLFSVRREDSSYPFLFFIQMRYSPSVMRVSRYRMGVRQASRMAAGRLPVA